MFDIGTPNSLGAVAHCLPPAGSCTKKNKIQGLASMECLHIIVKLKICMLNDYDLGAICPSLHKQIV